MARYILCEECEKRWVADRAAQRDRIARRDELDDGRTERMRRGTARHPLRCDGACNAYKALPVGARCCAVTVSSAGSPDLFPWELDYLEIDPSWWWFSFADPGKPRGQTFLGACVVGPDPGFEQAFVRTLQLGCNPGGEVRASLLDDAEVEAIPESYRGRLLREAEIKELSLLMGGPGELERM